MKLIITLLLILALGFGLYKYFSLDTNKEVQESLQQKEYGKVQDAVEDAIAKQMTAKAKAYVHDHNNYFVSKSDNVCKSAQSLFAGLEKFTSNPVECVAQVHSFTARIKSPGSDTYLCADTSGFSKTAVTEEGYRPGVSCK